MVYQRTLDKIDEWRERPHHERKTIALIGAISVMTILFIGWGFSVLTSFGSGNDASDASVVPADESSFNAYATSTGAQVRIVPESQAAGAASEYIQVDEDGYQVVPAQSQ